MMVFGIFMGLILIVGSIYDGKYYSLPVWLIVIGELGGLAGMAYRLLWCEETVGEVLVALVPGMYLLFLAFLTREQIGYGDGLILLAVGGCLGWESAVAVLFVALTLSFVVGLAGLVLKRAKGKSRIPFVPFLALGSLAVMLGGG